MNDNPYQAPEGGAAPATGVLSGTIEDLRSVARYQRAIMYCILVYLVSIFVQFALPENLRPILAVGVLLAGLVGAIFVFLLAVKVYGKATGILKQNGIRVGLLGADPSKI